MRAEAGNPINIPIMVEMMIPINRALTLKQNTGNDQSTTARIAAGLVISQLQDRSTRFDDPRIDKTDKGNKQTDPHAYRIFKVMGMNPRRFAHLQNDNRMKIIPSTKIAARATCQL